MTERRFPVSSQEPLVGEITFGAFSNPLMRAIMKEFGRDAFARSSACMEFEAFLKRIGAGGKTCLEIGTYHGITAVLLSQYFEQVICVSIDDDPKKLMKREIVSFLGIDNVEFLQIIDNKHKAEVVQRLDFDFAYMDGDHTHDTLSDWGLVNKCGRVLMHEAWPIQSPTWNLANSLPKDEVIWALHDCFAYWNRSGIAVCDHVVGVDESGTFRRSERVPVGKDSYQAFRFCPECGAAVTGHG